MRRLLFLVFLVAFVPSAFAQIETGAPVPLTSPDDGLAHPRFSPDGRYVALTSPSYEGLWVQTLATGERVQLTDEAAAGFGMSWSPDGEALLARVARYVEGRRENAVAVFDVPTRQRRVLSPYQSRMPAVPAWSADGARVGVAVQAGIETYATGLAPVLGKTANIALAASGDALVSLETGAVVRRPVEGAAILNLVPSPDGSMYAFEVLGGGLYVASTDGATLRSLGKGEHPTWSPDGRWIAFMRTQDDGHQMLGADLFAVPVEGGSVLQLTSTRDQIELFPQWTPDGASIAYDDFAEGRVYLLPVRY